ASVPAKKIHENATVKLPCSDRRIMIGFTIDRFQAVIPVTDHSGKIKSFLFYGKKMSPFLNTLNNPKPAPDPAAG
ncbi:hypothetical protein, partial [Paramuribaculum intestinale]